MACNPLGTMNSARFFYGDGASRSGDVAGPVSVPGAPQQQMWFRGAKSFDSAIDLLLKLGMSKAELIVFTGGSAGGLTVFLHLDHVRARMAVEAPNARVVGEPVCGYFLDAPNDGSHPYNVTYPLEMQYVYNMQNATGSLSPVCQATYGIDAWKCIMVRANPRGEGSGGPRAGHTAEVCCDPERALCSRRPTPAQVFAPPPPSPLRRLTPCILYRRPGSPCSRA